MTADDGQSLHDDRDAEAGRDAGRHAPQSGPLRIVLVDDQVLVRAGFAMVIDSQTDMTVVAQAADGSAGVEAVRQEQPDVVLMDVRMPRLDGIEATGQILAFADDGVIRTPKIIVLTTFDDDEYALRALQAGAAGFLLKDTLPEVLLDAIRTVVDGGAVIAPTTTRRLLDREFLPHLGGGSPTAATDTIADTIADTTASASPAEANRTEANPAEANRTEANRTEANRTEAARAQTNRLLAEDARRFESLTPREREVLVLIARGLSNTEIGQRLFLAQPTVKTHVGRILMKLAARDRVQAVVLAYEAGLVGPGA